ncbi:MAG: Crp/Fnr family transcriptional regulator, partial [Bacteroidota bacterium]
PPDAGDLLRSLCHEISLKKGDFLTREGDIVQHSYFIEEGLIRMYYLREGQEFIRQFFFEGGLISDLVSALSQIPTRLHMDVLEDSRIIAIPIEILQRFKIFRDNALEQALFHVSNRMASIFLDTPEQKYQQLLDERPKVIQRIPQYMIAAYIGVTPEGLSRIKKRMHKGG